MSLEDKIKAAAVNIEAGPQKPHAHCRAFNVPARPAGAKFAFPRRFAGLRALPQSKIAGVLLQARWLNACPGPQFFRVAVRELAIIVIFADIKIDIASRRIRKISVH